MGILPSILCTLDSYTYSFRIHIAILEQVDDPQETLSCYMKALYVLRLRSSYIKENPQMRQTPTTVKGAMQDDEGWYVV